MTKEKTKNRITTKMAIAGIMVSSITLTLLAVIMEPKLQASWQEEQLASAISALQREHYVPNKNITKSVVARAAIVYDINSGEILYAKNIDTQLPIASITKIITALVSDSEIGSAAVVNITNKDLDTEGDSGLIAGDSWRERDLSDFMLTVSSNDASTALASKVGEKKFIAKMNQLVKILGLQSTVLFNESGLDVNGRKAGGYSSARDIANLLAYMTLVKPEILEATTFPEFNSVSMTGLRYKAVNTNKIAGSIPGFIGGKTGFTDLAGGNLAIVFDASIGRPVAVVVLGSTKDDRFDDVLKLVLEVI